MDVSSPEFQAVLPRVLAHLSIPDGLAVRDSEAGLFRGSRAAEQATGCILRLGALPFRRRPPARRPAAQLSRASRGWRQAVRGAWAAGVDRSGLRVLVAASRSNAVVLVNPLLGGQQLGVAGLGVDGDEGWAPYVAVDTQRRLAFVTQHAGGGVVQLVSLEAMAVVQTWTPAQGDQEAWPYRLEGVVVGEFHPIVQRACLFVAK